MSKLLKGIGELLAGLVLFFYGWRPICNNFFIKILFKEHGSNSFCLTAPYPVTVFHYIAIVVAIILGFFAIRNIVAGTKMLSIDAKTGIKGIPLFGIIAEVRGANGKVLGNPIQTVDVGVLMPDNSIRHFHSELKIGEQYDVGDFVCIKQHEDDINVIRLAETSEIPIDTVRILQHYPLFLSKGYLGEYVIRGAEIEDMTSIRINDKSYDTCFDYDVSIENGFYTGDSGMFYTDDVK